MPEPTREDAEAVWGRARELLAGSLPPSTLSLWVEPLRPRSIGGEIIYLSAPPTVRSWVERRYAAPIRAALAEVGAGVRDFAFTGPDERGSSSPEGAWTGAGALVDDPARGFERFVIGPGNRLAHAAALAVAESPGEAYNPLFLHGPPGLGKSHLLAAIATYMRRRHPALSIHHTTAERFTSEFVAALRKDGPSRFKARYRELDALLIDDVQVLEGKPRTEEEFVHTFNALHATGKQIVLSSDRPPGAFTQIADRLRDRFSWGLCAAIDEPDARTRVALLWRLAAASSLEVPDAALLQRIAARAPSNVRGLEGAMTRVLAHSSLLGRPIDAGLIDAALAPRPGAADQSSPSGSRQGHSVEEIQRATAATHGLSARELLSSKRTPSVARARQIAMYLARESTGMSLAQIARAFQRDHTTVLHAVRAVEGRLEPGSETEAAIHNIRSSLGENRSIPGPPVGGGPPPGGPSTGSSTASPRQDDAIGEHASPPVHDADTSEREGKMKGQ